MLETCLGLRPQLNISGISGKDPVIGFAVFAVISPENKSHGENRMNRNWLLRCLGLASPPDSIGDRARHVHGALRKVDVTHLRANSSPWRKPVEAVTSTIVRSRSAELSNRNLTSARMTTLGTARLLALWRTSLIGLRSNYSYRHA
jgi:hypothetical protein